jgi:solute carrier family 34 (sodium-dependent phosphate cotransporter)
MIINKYKDSSFFKFILIIILLNLFFISINLLGAFKGDAKEFAKTLLLSLYDNPFLGLLVGILVTSIMQSSSATTSIVVTFVASGFFGSDLNTSLYAAIPVIMGANIGTSITNTIVSLGSIGDVDEFKRAASAATVHDVFNFCTVIVLFPIQIYTNFLGKMSLYFANIFTGKGVSTFKSPLDFIIKPQLNFLSNLIDNKIIQIFIIFFILSFILVILFKFYIIQLIKNSRKNRLFFYLIILYISILSLLLINYNTYILNYSFAVFSLGLMLLFVSLNYFVKIMKDLASGKLEVLFNRYFFKTPLTAFVVGMIITILVQSSSVTTSIIVPLAGAGIVNVYQVFPYTLGANVGTTITALLAAISLGSVGAICVAFAHLFFNFFGIIIIYPLRSIPIYIAKQYANLVAYSKLVPIFIVLFFYIVIPFLFIVIFR